MYLGWLTAFAALITSLAAPTSLEESTCEYLMLLNIPGVVMISQSVVVGLFI